MSKNRLNKKLSLASNVMRDVLLDFLKATL